jgi:hypothetical protein
MTRHPKCVFSRVFRMHPPQTGGAVGTMTTLRGRQYGIRIPAGPRLLSLVQNVQAESGAHFVSCSTGTRCPVRGDKAEGTWGWPLDSIQCRGQEWEELHLHFPHTPSRCIQNNLNLYTSVPPLSHSKGGLHAGIPFFMILPGQARFYGFISLCPTKFGPGRLIFQSFHVTKKWHFWQCVLTLCQSQQR